jgi:hypothetical protein
MSSMSETGVPSSTSSGSASTIREIGTPVPEFLAVRPGMALERRALMDVQVPIGDAALHCREGSIVADDLGNRIRRRHVARSCASLVSDTLKVSDTSSA